VKTTVIYNAIIINENKRFKGGVVIEGDRIFDVFEGEIPPYPESSIDILINADKKYLIPGVIDDQVHFREPGLTHKAEIYTESKAAVAGGITSFMEMPNTIPQTTTQELLQKKFDLAAEKSLANYSFFLGATNENIEEILKTDPQNVCGVKIFMGSSTGNMLVDNRGSLEEIFSQSPVPIAVHCEDEQTIRSNVAYYRSKYGDQIPIIYHPLIRSREACYKSSSLAIELAKKHNARLHILHLSTKEELSLLDNKKPSADKNITAEACIHHLWFDESHYDSKGTLIKWNPAVKSQEDRLALIDAVNNGILDVIATDHAPHTIEEKSNTYFNAPSGGPLVQHSLPAMLEMVKEGHFTLEKVVEKMCHTPADIFNVKGRGYLRKGYFADLVLIDPEKSWVATLDNTLYKCGWTPFKGQVFSHSVSKTIINGNIVYDEGTFYEDQKGTALKFSR
jgi:dihydroorotase